MSTGENLERERFVEHARASYTAGLQFAHAKAWLEAANRGAIHLSLVILYSLGGWLVLNNHMPLRVMLTGIGFTFSLMFATQVCSVCLSAVPCSSCVYCYALVQRCCAKPLWLCCARLRACRDVLCCRGWSTPCRTCERQRLRFSGCERCSTPHVQSRKWRLRSLLESGGSKHSRSVVGTGRRTGQWPLYRLSTR